MNNKNLDILGLTESIVKKDKYYARYYGVIKVLYWVLIGYLFLDVITLIVSGDTMERVVTSCCFFIGFSLAMVFVLQKQKELKQVDYSLSALEMLRKFKKRYRMFPSGALWFLIGIIFILVGEGIRGVGSLIIFLAIMIISFIVGVIIHYVKIKPLVDSAKQLIDELEGE